MKNNRRSKNRLGQIVLAGMLTGLGVYANAGEFTLIDNKLTIVGSGASAGFSQSATVDSTGAVTNVANVPISTNVGIPSFNFQINQNNVVAGTYTFTIGVIFDDDNNSSRLETKITTLNLTVDGSGGVTGTIPAQNLRLLGRTSSGSVQISADIPNSAANGPVTVTGGTVSFNGSNLISRISNSNSYFKDLILPEFNKAASYTYTIVIEQTNGAAQQFGIDSDAGAGYTFAAFPDAAVGTFILANNELATHFPSAQRVTGTFNVVVSSGGGDSGGGTTNTETVTGASTATTTATTAVDNAFNNGGTPTQEQVTQLVTASQQLNTVLTNTSATTVTTTDLTSLGASVKGLVQTNVKNSGSSAPSTSITSNTNAVLSSAAKLLKSFSEKTTLTAVEAKAGYDIVKDLLLNAPGFFAGSKEDNKNLQSMNDLTAAIFVMGKKTVPPVEFKSSDYLDVRKALDELNEKKNNGSGGDEVADESTVYTGDGGNGSTIVIVPGQPATLSFSGFDPGEPTTATAPDAVTLGATADYSNFANQSSNGFLQAASTPILFENDSTNGTVKVTVGEKVYVGKITTLVLLPSSLSATKLIAQRNGTILLTVDGLGYIISSFPAKGEEFVAAVKNSGFDLAVRVDGGFDIKTGPSQNFSGVFAFDDVAAHQGECGTMSIAASTSAVNSPNYSFTGTCATSGLQLRVLPYISQSAFYNLGQKFNVNITTARDSGVINVSGIGSFKPSFFSNALTINDQALLTSSAVNGFAFRSSDVNGDGKLDFEVIHSSGVQVLYGL